MESDERELWIEKYINNQLDDKSLKEFRLLVDNDPLLATELKAYEKIDSGLHGLGLNKLKSEVNTWESALKKQIPKQEINLKPVFYYSVAATILILIVSVVFLFNKQKNNGYNQY